MLRGKETKVDYESLHELLADKICEYSEANNSKSISVKEFSALALDVIDTHGFGSFGTLRNFIENLQSYENSKTHAFTLRDLEQMFQLLEQTSSKSPSYENDCLESFGSKDKSTTEILEGTTAIQGISSLRSSFNDYEDKYFCQSSVSPGRLAIDRTNYESSISELEKELREERCEKDELKDELLQYRKENSLLKSRIEGVEAEYFSLENLIHRKEAEMESIQRELADRRQKQSGMDLGVVKIDKSTETSQTHQCNDDKLVADNSLQLMLHQVHLRDKSIILLKEIMQIQEERILHSAMENEKQKKETVSCAVQSDKPSAKHSVSIKADFGNCNSFKTAMYSVIMWILGISFSLIVFKIESKMSYLNNEIKVIG